MSTILSSLLSAPSLSITSNNPNGSPLNIAKNLGVSKVAIKLRARVFRHKREDGTTIVDARVIEPKYVEIDVYAPSIDDIALVNSVMIDRESTYTVKSRGLVFKNMMMDEGGIKQTAEMISASPIHIVFKELLTQNQTNVGQTNVSQPADSTLIDRGIQQLSSAVQTVQGLASDIQNTIGGAVTEAANNLGL